MAAQVAYPGRLIAVDGSRGKDISAAASALAAALKADGIECAVSRWDASGLFTELAAGAQLGGGVSMRSLSLIYAADLAFRLRWEIRPQLESGGVVIAASYVETAVAFGASCGLDEEWIRQLLRFAPDATVYGRTAERKATRPWKRKLERGYCEFSAAMLDVSAPRRASQSARRVMISKLDHPRGHKCVELDAKGVQKAAKKVTGSRPAVASRPSSRPRNGRK
jgi:thymidylate kinase